MDKLRRAITNTIGATLVGVNLQIITAPSILSEGLTSPTAQVVTGPTIEPDEYLSLCEASIGTWWQWLYQGNNAKLDRVLSENIPVLKRLAYTLSPFQKTAASFAVEANIMQIHRATANLQYSKRESYGADLVHFGELSGDRKLHAAALYRHGDTFTYCYNQPQTAIDHFDTALSILKNESLLIMSKIYSNLSIAYAQKGNEIEAMKYAVMARSAMPEHPELDPSYQYSRGGHAELDQYEGRTRLFLADSLSSRNYAREAYEAFDESTNKQAVSRGMQAQAYIRKADAARAMGEMRECIDCMTKGVDIATERVSLDRLAYAHDIIGRMPTEWKQETDIQDLRKDITHTIVVARR